MSEKTIALTGAETEVHFSGGNAWLRNDGASTVYAAKTAGVAAGADGVVSIPAGGSAPVYGANGTVYLLGSGSVQLVGSDYATNPFKSTVTIGSVTAEIVRAVSNKNYLDNPDFRVNQYGTSGTITDTGYFIDRWKLTAGSVTINSDKTLTLNGTMVQILENAVGIDVTASSNAGTASYDNNTKTFTLTASGEKISWTKLETGGAATHFVPPDPATELAKCQRYYQRLSGSRNSTSTYGVGFIGSTSYATINIALANPMRIAPTTTINGEVCVATANHNGGDGVIRTSTWIPGWHSSPCSATVVVDISSANDASIVGNACLLQIRGVDSYIELSAEL